MIYPPNYPSDYGNPAEKKVYEALGNLPGEEYDVFFHKTFSGTGNRQDDDYEIDFLVADLRNGRLNGIMVIEVKGGYMSFSGVENCWFQSGRRMVPGPDDQARKNKHNFIQRFKTLIPGVPVDWIIWFPEGVLSGDNVLPVNLCSWQVLDNHSLAKPEEGITLAFDKIYERHSGFPGEPFKTYKERLKFSLLHGLGIMQPLNILLKRYDERYFHLEREQKDFFSTLYQIKKLAVEGGAGSGKTVLAAAAAIDAGNEGKNVLFLCFNRMLYHALDATVSGKLVKVSTFHTFAYEFVNRHDPEWLQENPGRDNPFYMQLLPGKFSSLLKKNPPKKKYDVLIVDEAQDFELSWLEMVFSLVREDGRFVLFFDENQNIFDRGFNIPDIDKFFRFRLERNYRNTRKICSFTEKYTGIEVNPGNTPEGAEVEVLDYNSPDDLLRKLERTLLKLVQVEKVALTDIVILVDGHTNEHPLGKVARIGPYPLEPWAVDRERDPGKLYFTSVNRFKGLESHVVLLVLNRSPELQGNKLFYTQCTRAKSVLKVYWKG